MKHKRFFRILAVAVILSLLMLAIPFTAVQAALILNPAEGAPGTVVAVSGTISTSYTGQAYIFFLQGGGSKIFVGNAQVDATDHITGSFTVPATAFAGTATLFVYDQSDPTTGTLLASTTFNIVTCQIEVSPTSGYVGETTVTVTGTGFSVGQTMTLYFDAAVIANTSPATITTDSSGNFTATFIVPASIGGSHTVKAQNALAESATAAFTITPKITVDPTSGGFGDTVTVDGTGFAASSAMTIYFDAAAITSTTPATVTTGTTGSFTADFIVPDVATGAHTVKAQDASSAYATADFTVSTSICASPTTSVASPGNVGDEITISGRGFLPSTPITITFTSDPVTFTTTSLADGSFTYVLEVPPSAAGAHTISATDGTNTVTTTFYMEADAPPIPQPQLPYMLDKVGSQPEFDWDSVSDDSTPVTYELQVATDENFTTILVSRTGLTLSEYTLTDVEALESTSQQEPYYWRVRAVDAASNASAWSPVGTFYVGFTFSISGWVQWLLVGIGAVLVFVLGFWLGRRSTPGEEDYYYEA